MQKISIKKITAREILASASYPTIETTVTLSSGVIGKASVPYGVSAGSHEASVIVDNKKSRYGGRGCQKVVSNVETKILSAVRGKKIKNQRELDDLLTALDPSPRKTKLGGNAILSVSLAFARAMAVEQKKPLYRYIKQSLQSPIIKNRKQKIKKLPVLEYSIPRPMMVVIEGGKHGENSTDFQEYLVCPLKNIKYSDSVRIGIEVYHALKKVLKKNKYNTNVGTEGAFVPSGIKSNETPLKLIVEAIELAGYKPGVDVGIALDPASSEFYFPGKKRPYFLACENKRFTALQMIKYYEELLVKYPIFSIEDGLDEDDWDSWTSWCKKFGQEILIMGDDLTVTQKKFLEKAIELKAINSILIKPNQVGTLTETLNTIALAKSSGFYTIVSHRGGGDTNDTFIMDLAYAVGSLFTKVGPSRGERVEKYNRMLEIAEEVGR
ncbi:MAG: phosphopyruvate hydratase [Candidatus Magasanikbacteria bacterium CG_4_10_14_0_2_um_filter_37_12]|uniref:Enolase n=1 Tax=Candidatus Magasanikbacteria bacterium CG_4_10_14_0_2_um_filter_37_12 TaxID=1974637 RepID=A0A2M7VAJ2_9BACT|nr:MAG: phosphopyruvate hydratase [Candidatus Magasanikbacteria bacterium CG_4_10_14_0_2_um_filter_37_12]